MLPGTSNVRPLANQIRGSLPLVAEALDNLQTGIDSIEGAIRGLSDPHARAAVRVDGSKIIGNIAAPFTGQINATQIVGQLSSTQIGSVNATAIQGLLQSSQIQSIVAEKIEGVIISEQLAEHIIDSISLLDPSLEIPSTFIESIEAEKITGLILGAQIDSITAGQITGQLQANQIAGVNASAILGDIQADQISSITVDQITGQLQASQIAGVNASTILGLIQADQISSITADQVTGQLQANQIAGVNASAILGEIQANQINSINANQISGQLQANQIGAVNVESLVGTISGSQIGNLTITNAHIQNSTIITDKLNISQLIVEGATLSDNTPTAGFIQWTPFTAYLNGSPHSFSGSSTDKKFVWFNSNDEQLHTGDEFQPAPYIYPIFTNTEGIGDLAWQKVAQSGIQEDNLAFTLLQGFQVQPIAHKKVIWSTIISTPDVNNVLTVNGVGGAFVSFSLVIRVLPYFSSPTLSDIRLVIQVDDEPPQSVLLWDKEISWNHRIIAVADRINGSGTAVNDNFKLNFGLGWRKSISIDIVTPTAEGKPQGGDIDFYVLYAIKTSA